MTDDPIPWTLAEPEAMVIIRRITARRRVTAELRIAVFERDQGCVAPRLGGSALDCHGRLTIEHVKRDLRMGLRAESRMDRLVSLCEGHTEPGMKAGYCWNTDKRNRALVRDYLARVETA